MPDVTLSPKQYAELQTRMARLAGAVAAFPSDVMLRAVRIMRSYCTELETDAAKGGTVNEDDLKHCAEQKATYAFVEDCAIGLTAARIRIENAMSTYAETAEKRSALVVSE